MSMIKHELENIFSKRDAASLKSDPTKRDAMRLESVSAIKDSAVRSELSWTHYRLLLRVAKGSPVDLYSKLLKSKLYSLLFEK